MADWDSADLLARFLRTTGVPSARSFPLDADIYAWLTEANAQWHHAIAQFFPWSQVGDKVLLTTSDDGETYDFPSGVWPMGSIEVYSTKVRGNLLRPGTEWDRNADYTWEGDKIRIPNGKTKAFSDGPYARYMLGPGTISASVEPTLKPPSVNILLVVTAAAFWADRGGMKDPKPFLRMAQQHWAGDGSTQFGIYGMLSTQDAFRGLEAFPSGAGGILDGVDGSAGY